MVTRGMVPKGPGTILFSMKALMTDTSKVGKALSEGPYTKQALIPSFPWLPVKPLKTPSIKSDTGSGELKLTWSVPKKETPSLFVLYTKRDSTWTYEILPGKITEVSKRIDSVKISAVAISAVDRSGNETRKKILEIK